jgi:UrcA family protein
MASFGFLPVSTIADQPAATTSVSRVADVSLSDLDLSTLEGSRTAVERLDAMARRLCGELASRHDLSYQPNYAACVHDTLVGALAQADVLAAADHRRFTLATDIKVYFCDPQNPWQRGSNENTNGLLRQYFPKGTDLSLHSQAKLNAVARQLNERPRKTLNFETPAQRFSQCVALTS